MALVLVADDDADLRELVRIRLSGWGHEVLTVPDGTAALDALEQYPVDLALVDLTMPGMDGLEVIREVRDYEAESGADRMPIIMISGSTRPSDIATAFTSGADDYLVKPFRLHNLVAVVGAMAGTPEPVLETRVSA